MIQADQLKAFRQAAYQLLTRAKSATFELNDSTTWTPAIESQELEHPQLGQLHPRSSCSGDGWSFSSDWHTCCSSQTPWKISRLAHRTTTVTSYSLSRG
jgi:hypothetical protein